MVFKGYYLIEFDNALLEVTSHDGGHSNIQACKDALDTWIKLGLITFSYIYMIIEVTDDIDIKGPVYINEYFTRQLKNDILNVLMIAEI